MVIRVREAPDEEEKYGSKFDKTRIAKKSLFLLTAACWRNTCYELKKLQKTQWRQARIKGMIHMSMSGTTIKLKKMDTKQVDMNGRLQVMH